MSAPQGAVPCKLILVAAPCGADIIIYSVELHLVMRVSVYRKIPTKLHTLKQDRIRTHKGFDPKAAHILNPRNTLEKPSLNLP